MRRGKRTDGRSGFRLVAGFVRGFGPGAEGGLGGVAEERGHLDGALVGREGDLLVDEVVVETDRGGVGAGVAVEDGGDAGPVDRGEAHGAGLAAGVEFAVGELERVERAAGFADGGDLGVGGGVVGGGDAVVAAGDDLAAADDDAAEGAAAAGAHAFVGEADRFTHK